MTIIFFLIAGGIVFKTFNAESLGPSNPSCTELGTCDLFHHPLDAMLQPWVDVFGPITYVLIWGIILGILWLRTHNTLMVASVGIVIAGFFTIQGLNTINPQILIVGLTLVGVSIGVVIYQLVFSRLAYPQ